MDIWNTKSRNLRVSEAEFGKRITRHWTSKRGSVASWISLSNPSLESKYKTPKHTELFDRRNFTVLEAHILTYRSRSHCKPLFSEDGEWMDQWNTWLWTKYVDVDFASPFVFVPVPKPPSAKWRNQSVQLMCQMTPTQRFDTWLSKSCWRQGAPLPAGLGPLIWSDLIWFDLIGVTACTNCDIRSGVDGCALLLDTCGCPKWSRLKATILQTSGGWLHN